MQGLIQFFLFTYLASWILFSAAGSIAGTTGRMSGLAAILGLLGTFVPAFVALALTARVEGRAGLRALLLRTIQGRVAVRWYVFAIGYMAAIKIAAALVQRVTTGAWPAFGRESLLVMAVAIVLSTPVQAGEEIGWRGYALGRLAAYFGLGGASVVLGVLWGCWHLPLFFIPASNNFGQSFPVYLVQVTALSVAIAWLYWRTNGSLLLTMLMHAAINNTRNIVPSRVSGATHPFAVSASATAWVTVALLWICAIYLLGRMRSAKLPVEMGAPQSPQAESP
jgi:CAAX protease family protein